MKQKSIAVMFGGPSAEHEISIITALQAITAMDTLQYKVIPVYIHPTGKWYTGEALLTKSIYSTFQEHLPKLQEVTLLPDPNLQGLIRIDKKQFSPKSIIPIDVYFLAFHGQYGEDGCVQGLLEMANAAYTGCGVASSAVTMNKYLTKTVLQSHGIPVLPSVTVSRVEAQKDLNAVHEKISQIEGLKKFPLFVKPVHLGSSIAISRADDRASLNAAIAKVFRYDNQAIIEPCITDLLEINIAVLHGHPPIASVVEIPVSSSGALTYEDKYLRGGNKSSGPSSGMASLTRIIDPQDIDRKLKQQVTDYAINAYTILGCRGVSRLDFIVDKASGALYFNELNSIPGSLAFYLWEKSDPRLLYTQVIDRMIAQAIERKAEQLCVQRDLGFKALRG